MSARLTGEVRWGFDRLARNRFILGSPEECIEQIDEHERRLGTKFILARFDWTPGLGQRDILASIELFGQEVIPYFKKERASSAGPCADEDDL